MDEHFAPPAIRFNEAVPALHIEELDGTSHGHRIPLCPARNMYFGKMALCVSEPAAPPQLCTIMRRIKLHYLSHCAHVGRREAHGWGQCSAVAKDCRII